MFLQMQINCYGQLRFRLHCLFIDGINFSARPHVSAHARCMKLLLVPDKHV